MRTVTVYAVLLVLALVGAYWSMTHEPAEATTENITVLDVDRDDIKEVRYVADDLQVTLIPRSDERGDYVWARTVRTPDADKVEEPEAKKDPSPGSEPASDAASPQEGEAESAAVPPADPGAGGPDAESREAAPENDGGKDSVAEDAPAAAESPAEPKASRGIEPKPAAGAREPEVQEFKAAESAEQMFERWAPFVATRELTGIDDGGLEELGLADPKATLTLVLTDGEEEVFDLGGTIFGGASRYVRHRETGALYLVDSGPLRSLGNADRTLLDRELFRLKPSDMVNVEVSSQGKTIAFRQQNPDDLREAYWSIAGEERKSDTADAWIKKLSRVRVRSYVKEGETPSNLASVFEFVIEDENGSRTKVEMLRGLDSDGKEAWFARSDHSRSLVQLHSAQASDAAADVPTVLDPEAKALPPDEAVDPRQPANGPPLESPAPTTPGPMMPSPPGHGPPPAARSPANNPPPSAESPPPVEPAETSPAATRPSRAPDSPPSP